MTRRLVGYIHNGRYVRVEDETDYPETGESSAPAQTRWGTSVDYRPGTTSYASRAAYDRRDTREQVDVLYKRESARMRGDLDAAARYEHQYHTLKRSQFRRDPGLREQMEREWPREPESRLRLPHIR